ncbi:MAG: alpha/beta fold hydrolase [Anaerolineales bacterium]|nr:alpha/beta fold hydrolase [Anaerolineales bacterium]
MENNALHNAQLAGDSFFWEAGPVGVLLLHGLTATTAEVRPLARYLHQHGYTVAGPLLPGHGTRPEDLNQVKWRDWVQTAEADFHHLLTICDRVLVGGESTGAVVALYLASRYPEAAAVLAYAPAIKLATSTQDVLRLYAAAPFIEFIPKADLDGNDLWQGYRVNPLRGVMELLRLGREVRGRLPRITQPVLVVQGRHDTAIDPAAGQIILEGVSSTVKELVWMPHSSHVVAIDAEWEEVAALTLEFVERVGELVAG